MRVLILGGTRFLGRHLTEAALRRGHEVTLFNRGNSNPRLFPEAERLHGDREGDLSVLRARSWDVVVDTCGYVPRAVRVSAGLLAESVDCYVFISSISVYEDFSRPGLDEDSPVRTPPEPEPAEMEPEIYGEIKVGCERAAEAAFPGRTLTIRPGMIVGPYDYTNRFPYWCRRVAEGGEVLAPGAPGRRAQLIDARDLAGWTVRMAEERQAGVYNATGPEHKLTMRGMLEEIQAATGSDAHFTWASEGFLLETGVRPWEEMPFWVPEGLAGILSADVSRAVGAGLRFRPLADTVRDTLVPNALPNSPPELDAGISRERERELLRTWHEATRRRE